MTIDLKELGEALRPFLDAAETTVSRWDGVKHVEISPPDDQVFPAGPLTWGDLRRLARAAEGVEEGSSLADLAAVPQVACPADAEPSRSDAMTAQQMMDGLEIYTPDGGDWMLEVRHTLTEPTCPTAIVRAEDEPEDWPYFRADAETIEEAIYVVVRSAYETLIERKPKPQTVPWSEPGEDKRLAKFLAALDASKARVAIEAMKAGQAADTDRQRDEAVMADFAPAGDGDPSQSIRGRG